MNSLTPVGPDDVFPRMSAAPLCRASALALLYFTVLVSCGFLVMDSMLASSTGDDVTTLIASLPATTFVAALIGTLPTLFAFLLAAVLQRTLDHCPRRWVHRVTASTLGGVVALAVMTLLSAYFPWPYRVGVVLIVAISASVAAGLAWEVTRRKIDRAILRYGVRG
ncbi:hypothetical protein [Microbacterium sp. ZW T5_56]|uniref:hypothetical protein n=1 Tax=Microbacterium sp. ZW T5_56 TaxID=3378081 RepID=UPI003851F0C8